MPRFDPGLDQPITLDVDGLDPGATWTLANPEIRFEADSNSDLLNFIWPAAEALYARRVRMRLTPLGGDELAPLANRYYPACQETILGSEGLIVSKRLVVPFHSAEERAALWSLECQAEGDSVLRIEVDIDWGEALTQRMVDGLLVAQRNPRAGQGIYKQSNAESTRIFGNPHGPPESILLDDVAGSAHLVWYVLVNGEVDVSFVLTASDVGEQVAWNAFLSLRDVDQILQATNSAWEGSLRSARLWTPDVRFNRAVQAGKRETLTHLVHLRTGLAAEGRSVLHASRLVDSLDAFDVTSSRNLLAHLRRTVERSQGRMPLQFGLHPKSTLEDPGRHIARTNGAYLGALNRHLSRHFDATLLQGHFEAVSLCSESLIEARRTLLREATAAELMEMGAALRAAQALATMQRDGANTVRWESEACEMEREGEAGGANRRGEAALDLRTLNGWRMGNDRPWHFADPWLGIDLAAQAVWKGAGVAMERGALAVRPGFPREWGWWALLGLATPLGSLSIAWDGERMHSTLPLRTGLPVTVHGRIRALHTDELDFDLTFEFGGPGDAPTERSRFRPVWANGERRDGD